MYQMEQEPKRRKDAGILQVTDRDIIALTWIADQFSISFDQLQRLLGKHAKAETKRPDILSVSATRDTLTRWLQLGFIEEPRKVIASHSSYIWLSRRGLSQLNLPYAYYRPPISNAKHIYAVNQIRLHLESYDLRSVWYPERALSQDTTQKPLPDGELRIVGINHVAIKVIEAPFKHDAAIFEAIEVLKKLASRYTSLWYFLHIETVELFQQALFALDQEIQVTLYGLDAQVIPTDREKQTPSVCGGATQLPPT